MSPDPKDTDPDDPRPTMPADSDCCGTGCEPCVFDLYDRDLAAWKRRRLGAGSGAGSSVDPAAAPLDQQEFRPFVAARVHLSPPGPHAHPRSLVSLVEFDDLSSARLGPSLTGPAAIGAPGNRHVWLRPSLGDPSRQYTPFWWPGPDGRPRVYLYCKTAPESAMSRGIAAAGAGTALPLRGVSATPSSLCLSPNKFQRVTLLAAGSGIAACLQILSSILLNDRDDTMLDLVWAVRDDQAEIVALPALLDILAAMSEYVTLRPHLVVSSVPLAESGAGPAPDPGHGRLGRIFRSVTRGQRLDQDLLLGQGPVARMLGLAAAKRPALTRGREAAFLCGPATFTREMRRVLVDVAGWPAEQVEEAN
ncbi:hypothetical protein H696_02068 [Fonticula alba]|uniref:Oxidoreductase-like domain-containing protein n=1 Tax=Fonticula alba TaxID=691883 RepID=A0A058ZB20_FONAL|nr:hypothetical protein H696_02068 [Fonticula alba]KCV71118.1 hypothetical protein H696_02068 [Fonticula alba]|eukprot:XP_009494241.1 hypothetical protein H696_02068 [Fonticula alba]